jgi:gas vesicle protein
VEEIVWSENVVDTIVHIRAIQTEITQSRTILQTMHVTAGYILAMVSGVLFLAGLTFILAPTGTLFKKTSETSVKLKSYQDYLQNLKQLKSQMNMLKTMYEQGEIDEDTYLRLSNEIDEKISNLRNILTQERTAYENELRSLDEQTSILKKRFEELMARRRIGLIDQNAFEREMKQIRKELEDIKSKREYIRSLLEALKAEEI